MMRPASTPYDHKAGAKRWAAVLDGEAKPLTDDALASRSEAFEAGYREYMRDEPLEVPGGG